MSHHKLTNRDGFTLPEVIVAIAVLVLVIFSATNLVVSIIRTNAENIHAITAYGLAQEGLEAVRNIRDSNWLLGAKFNGELGTTAKEIWGESFPKNPGEERMYTVNVGVSERPNFQIETVDALIPYTPWKLKSISDAEDEDTVIEKFVDDQSGQVTYRHGGLIAGLSTSVYGVILGRFLQGAGAIASVLMAFLSDLTQEDNRTKAMAAVGMTIGLTFAVSLILGPFLTEHFGL